MTETATLGGGCFWCLEAVFQELEGVESVVSGYAGGHAEDPSYDEVCSGSTGHTEVVQVTFDPDTITYRDILEVFFTVHDPTTKDRQGADVGTQYRSIVLAHDDRQAKLAEEVMAELAQEDVYEAPIVTELEALDTFYAAEAHHQNYYRDNPGQGYCRAVISPKVATFRKRWQHRLREGSAG